MPPEAPLGPSGQPTGPRRLLRPSRVDGWRVDGWRVGGVEGGRVECWRGGRKIPKGYLKDTYRIPKGYLKDT